MKGLVEKGIVDHAHPANPAPLDTDGDTEAWIAVGIVYGAVERVHNPAPGGTRAVGTASLFGHDRILGPSHGEFIHNQAFACAIHLGHEIDGSALCADGEDGLVTAPLERAGGTREPEREFEDQRRLGRGIVQGAAPSERRNSRRALAAVAVATSETATLLTAASTSPTRPTWQGSLRRPRKPSGASRGESVSTRSAESGSFAATSRSPRSRLKVRIPENETKSC